MEENVQKDINDNKKSGDISLNEEYYEEIDSTEVYSEEKRTAKVFGAKDKKKNQALIRIVSKSKMPWGWKMNYGFNLYNIFHVNKLFAGLRKAAKAIGWKVNEEEDIERIKVQLRYQEEAIINLQHANEEAREEHENLLQKLRIQQEKLFKSRIEEFKKGITELEMKIETAIVEKNLESELQEMLYESPWMFGTEYVNAEPQKLRGAHSRFDFYLERFNKTNDIVEIKLLSDSIINKDGTINAKVTQAVDQLIGYIESSIASAHSTVISEEEGIRELRPRGIIIIGSDSSKEAKEKLHKWNYQFSHITILTYFDVLQKGKALLSHIEKEK